LRFSHLYENRSYQPIASPCTLLCHSGLNNNLTAWRQVLQIEATVLFGWKRVNRFTGAGVVQLFARLVFDGIGIGLEPLNLRPH